MTMQEELGKRVGVSRQAINDIVREKYAPLPLVFKLTDVFGLSIEEVFIRDKGVER